MAIQTSGADTSIYRNIKGFNDYQAAAQQQGLANALAMAKLQQLQNPNMGQSPAALQIADEYRLARETGDTARMKDIELFTKAYDKGLVTGDNGIEALQGYGQAVGGIAAQKAGATEAAKLGQQLNYAGDIAVEKGKGGALGKELGTAAASLSSQSAKLPELQRNVEELSALGKKATYTKAGQAINALKKEAGLKPSEAAIARTEYISKVDSQILPLLRDTFGAAFTEKEGNTLRATLGDANKTPEEKDVVLKSFIRQKEADLRALNRQVGGEEYFVTPQFGDGLGNTPKKTAKTQAQEKMKVKKDYDLEFDPTTGTFR